MTIYENGTIQSLVASFQSVPGEVLKKNILEWIDINQLKLSGEIYCNPAGDWNIGGLDADAGLTGRKIICDAYGPNVYVGGGAFSGKDATKVDRSGAIYARHLAKKEIENRTKYDNEFYSECVVKIAYSIGMEKPLMVTAETTTHYINGDYEVNKKIINDTLTVQETIEMLDLRKPNFEKMAEWGPFFQPLPKRKKIMYN